MERTHEPRSAQGAAAVNILKDVCFTGSRSLFLPLFLLFLAAFQTATAWAENSAGAGRSFDGARSSTMLHGLKGVENVGMISPSVFRGNQPTREGYQTLRGLGIKTVINLRSRHAEKAAVEAAGMRSIAFPLGMVERISTTEIREIVRAMVDSANQPVFVHCALGQDRTGVVIAAYRMEVDGWTRAEAEEEMQAFGFNDAWIHLKRLVRRYAEELETRADARKR